MTNAAKKQSEGVQKKLDTERAERATREKLEAEQAALKLLAHRKHTLAFNTEWSGHPTAKYLEQVEEFNVWYDAGEKKGGEVFRQPMVVKKIPSMPNYDPKVVFANYTKAAEQHFKKNNTTRALADMEQRHGSVHFLDAFRKFLPEGTLLKEALPSTQDLTSQVTIFCYGKDHSSPGEWEQQCLGSLLYLYQGRMSFLLIPADELQKSSLCAEAGGAKTGQQIKMSSVKIWFEQLIENFSVEIVKKLKDYKCIYVYSTETLITRLERNVNLSKSNATRCKFKKKNGNIMRGRRRERVQD